MAAAAWLVACSALLPDLVEQRRFSVVAKIERLAVVPFYPGARLSQRASETGTTAADAAALVTRFVSEALELRDVDVIPENDMLIAFEGQGQITPRGDPKATALLASAEFGAHAILLGEVRRYRKREGSAYGSMSPASVDFEVTLYSAPAGDKLWSARFDQTQTSLTSDLFDTARYPGGGTRFLTVAELAQWGARLITEELPLGH
jgi:hypothetical protein